MKRRLRTGTAAAAWVASLFLAVTPLTIARAQIAAAQAATSEPSRNDLDIASLHDKTDQQKGLAGRALDKAKEAVKQAGDILGRVPCLAPKGGVKSMGSLPRVAHKLIDNKPVVIVAFGSSSTQGYGSSSPAYNYPNRLAAQLRRHYPSADITVINSGKGGEDAPEMMARLKATVLDAKPDLVIWQVGTNAILRNLDPGETGKLVDEASTPSRLQGPTSCWSTRNMCRASTSEPRAPAR